MHFGIQPDVITTAKGLGGGLPIGACLMGENVESVLGAGDHGSTYGGNPIASAGALSVISRLTDDFLAEVKAKGGRYLFLTNNSSKSATAYVNKLDRIGIESCADTH